MTKDQAMREHDTLHEVGENSDASVLAKGGDVLNRGVFFVNADGRREALRTYIVLGRTRGGTTMVAKALAALGVPMGEGIFPGNWEDIEVTRLLQAKAIDALRERFAKRNESHDVWGVKAPLMFPVIDQLRAVLRNPYYIVVMRDPVAIVSRLLAARAIQPNAMHAHLRSAVAMYQEIITFVERSNRPALYISYEKAIADREAAASAMAEFVGRADRERILAAAASIAPNSPEYLRAVARSVASGRSGNPSSLAVQLHRETASRRSGEARPKRERPKPLATPKSKTIETIKAVFPNVGGQPLVIAEVGIGEGATSRKLAELMNGKGELHLFDFEERVDKVAALLKNLGHQNVVRHGSSKALWDSYNWPLMKLIEKNRGPIFDYVYLDGAHTWLHDGLAFFLIDQLLKPGGCIDFDDYNWTYEWVATYHNRPVKFDRMTEEQVRTKQVKCIVDLLVKRDPRYKPIVENKVYQKT